MRSAKCLVGVLCVIGIALVHSVALNGQAAYTADDARQDALQLASANLQSLLFHTDLATVDVAGFEQTPSAQPPDRYPVPFARGDPRLRPRSDESLHWTFSNGGQGRVVTPAAIAYTALSAIQMTDALLSDRSEELLTGSDPRQRQTLADRYARAAGMGLRFAIDHLRDPSTEFYAAQWQDGEMVDSSVKPTDQIAMLWAFSELIQLQKEHSGLPIPLSINETKRRAQALANAVLTSDQFAPLERSGSVYPRTVPKLNPHDQGLLLQAIAHYVAAIDDPDAQERAIRQIQERAMDLVWEMDHEGQIRRRSHILRGETFSPLATQAAGVAGLAAASRVASLEPYRRRFRQAAQDAWRYLQTLWNDQLRLFVPQGNDTDTYRYSVTDAGDLLSAYHAALSHDAMDWGAQRRQQWNAQLATAFQTLVKRSGLQLASLRPDETLLQSRLGGGDADQAAVLAGSVAYTPDAGWEVVSKTFETSGAMFTAHQMIRLGLSQALPRLAPQSDRSVDQSKLLAQILRTQDSVRYLLGQLARQDRSLGGAAVHIQENQRELNDLTQSLEEMNATLSNLETQVSRQEPDGASRTPLALILAGLAVVLAALALAWQIAHALARRSSTTADSSSSQQ